MTDARILEIFREEAGERLDRMVDVLLGLDAGDSASDALDALFREAHSLKGGAGLVGIDGIGDAAHAIEELLGRAREDADQALAADALQEILGGVDAIRTLLAHVPSRTLGAPVLTAASPTTANAVRVSPEKLDRLLDVAGESVLNQRRLEHLLGADAAGDAEGVRETVDRGEGLVDELQHAVLQLRALPVAAIARTFPRFVRDLAASAGKEAKLVTTDLDVQLDRGLLEGLGDPLVHLLRNAVAHGLETPDERRRAGKPAQGRIELRAEQRGGLIAIEVSDDGRGVAPELLGSSLDGSLADVLSQAGFSTAQEVSEVAGRGVGLDAVRNHVEGLGGTLAVSTEPGHGTTITLLLPSSLAVLQVLLVEHDGQVLGLPVTSVAEVMAVSETLSLEGVTAIAVRDVPVRLADLRATLGGPLRAAGISGSAVVLSHGGTRVALACDRLLGEEAVIVKGLGPMLRTLPCYLGAAILGDGRIALIVDPAAAVTARSASVGLAAPPPDEARVVRAEPKVLVVDDQFTVRELQRSILEAAGYRVCTASDGREALDHLAADPEVELVVTDLQMPEVDGLALLRHVRKDPGLSTLPVIVVTSQTDDEDRRIGMEAGADAYVTKDRFDQATLLDTIERLVGR